MHFCAFSIPVNSTISLNLFLDEYFIFQGQKYNSKKLPSSSLKTTWTKRRRPAIQQHSSSKLAEEYSQLAKIKHECFEEEKKNIMLRRSREEQIFELEKKKLKLDIEIREQEFKKIKTQ